MKSPDSRIRHLLLLALSSDHPGEQLAAINRLQNTLTTMSHDAHWLVSKLQFEDDPYEEYGR